MQPEAVRERLVVGLGALVPLASRAHQERFWYDFRNCGFGVLGEGTTWVLRFDPFATDKAPIDVGWTAPASRVAPAADARRWRVIRIEAEPAAARWSASARTPAPMAERDRRGS